MDAEKSSAAIVTNHSSFSSSPVKISVPHRKFNSLFFREIDVP